MGEPSSFRDARANWLGAAGVVAPPTARPMRKGGEGRRRILASCLRSHIVVLYCILSYCTVQYCHASVVTTKAQPFSQRVLLYGIVALCPQGFSDRPV